MKSLVAILMIACAAGAQPGWSPNDLSVLRPAATAQSAYALTNFSGCVAWYDPEISPLNTNATVITLSDLGPFGYHLTNGSAASTWPITKSAGLNGFATLLSAGKNIRSQTLSASQPVDCFLVAALTNNSARVYFDCAAAFTFNSHQIQMNAGSTLVAGYFAAGTTNTWLVWNFTFNGASSNARTNNTVTGSTGNAGSASLSGLAIGSQRSLNFAASLEWATFAIFTNLDSAGRTAIFSALTNRYNLQ